MSHAGHHKMGVGDVARGLKKRSARDALCFLREAPACDIRSSDGLTASATTVLKHDDKVFSVSATAPRRGETLHGGVPRHSSPPVWQADRPDGESCSSSGKPFAGVAAPVAASWADQPQFRSGASFQLAVVDWFASFQLAVVDWFASWKLAPLCAVPAVSAGNVLQCD